MNRFEKVDLDIENILYTKEHFLSRELSQEDRDYTVKLFSKLVTESINSYKKEKNEEKKEEEYWSRYAG